MDFVVVPGHGNFIKIRFTQAAVFACSNAFGLFGEKTDEKKKWKRVIALSAIPLF